MLKVIIAVIIGALIGAACRFFDVPVPAPPKLVGAMLVVAITVGYVGTGWLLDGNGPDAAEPVAGGPSGGPAAVAGAPNAPNRPT